MSGSKLEAIKEMTPLVPPELRLELQAATRAVKWTYSVFWKPASSNQKTLVWGDGYYNGTIKTRKTIGAKELTPEEFGLQRSQQLRDLYNSLSDSKTGHQQASKPFALKPEDLAEQEWFFLLCMSCNFAEGVGLVGRAAADGRYAWQCKTNEISTKLFTRALLAKSASIQTIFCFPLMDGVVEFGTTEHVPEDSNIVQHVSSFFMERKRHSHPQHSVTTEQKHEHSKNSPQQSENVVHCNQLAEYGASSKKAKLSSSQMAEVENETSMNRVNSLLDPTSQEQRTYTHLFQQNQGSDSRLYKGENRGKNQSGVLPGRVFSSWKKNSTPSQKSQKAENRQKILKEALFRVTRLYDGAWKNKVDSSFIFTDRAVEDRTSNLGSQKPVPSSEETSASHVLAERRRREKLNDRFVALRELIPNVSKMDKASILGVAIEYVKELQSQLRALESNNTQDGTPRQFGTANEDATITNTTREHLECAGVVHVIDEDKAATSECTITEESFKPGHVNVRVSMNNDVAIVKLHCPYRQTLLVDVLQSLNDLEFDVCGVRSSISDDILSTVLEAKLRSASDGSSPTIIEVEKTLHRAAAGLLKERASASSLQ
ncbi:transcription factor TT8 isoform X2 [Physcomitrium patens]|uniref:BHLH domain-containing protein n=2 Tax=Physcomitrium patens TaxID=3218 RepID=A0A2K1IS25_PHYPA|nr:transcription factor TT8-like isoform X1 [Physcomitrium patens]XP_024359283.1 transcription factor TT8-like isoform X1 [Physcomitrium patens]XP_024359284.1 transcription factor TT8-like isoform X1 [Physcomitrium patens]XP_024359285.1 transcription factor TT8-like isoform X1 [Physcomitrium patens]XP_024359286.1 transcription factor TT8-like isoform X1 [Physcomitrium patens]XP_024359287.1 transcription factor TT8-like isoform X1 [Physcomitrium patens]PNR32083.1 hypothetical protein PHYPA_026|eukprot:XP_024359281.1 transcription factor TT8-like isoform X1 [Physcomitrella patens]